jgi:hypothetical protein
MSNRPHHSGDLTFRESDHTYWLGEPDTGTRLLGANEILSGAGLVDTRHFSKAAAERGTFVHQATEYYDREDMTLNEDELDDQIRPYLEAYKTFTQDCQAQWAHIERRMCDPSLLLAGTIDRIGTIRPIGKKKRKVVLDIKSGSSSGAPTHALQLACYQHLVTRELLLQGAAVTLSTKPKVERYALYLTKNGTYTLTHFTERTDIAVFMGARAVCLWRIKHGLDR